MMQFSWGNETFSLLHYILLWGESIIDDKDTNWLIIYWHIALWEMIRK
jgi:hypothetical protein